MGSPHYEKHKEMYKKKAREWALNNPGRKREIERNSNFKRLYGITLDAYNELFKKQKGLCALCGKSPFKENMCVDHDHETGKVRGLLHKKCNTALGLLNDDPKLVYRAVLYLRRK